MHLRSRLVEGTPSLSLDDTALAPDRERISANLQSEAGKRPVSTLAIGPDERVVDVSRGTGVLACPMADPVAGEGRVLGIDALPPRVGLAERGPHTAPEGHAQHAGRDAVRPPLAPRNSLTFAVDAKEMRTLFQTTGFLPGRIEIRESERRQPSPRPPCASPRRARSATPSATCRPSCRKDSARDRVSHAIGAVAQPDGSILGHAQGRVAIGERR